MHPLPPLKCPVLVAVSSWALLGTASAKSVSVNLAVWPIVDQQIVDPGESSVLGIPGAEAVDGTHWLDLDLRGAGSAGAPTVFTAATQGGNHIDLSDSTGADSGIDLSSSGAFYANFANVSTPNNTGTGDAALMQGFLNLNNTESISLSGLAAWAPDGYMVYAFFNIGPLTRTYGVSMTDGSLSQIYWTADTAGTDADADNDGVIEWLRTSATTSGSAVTDANYAVYGPFTGDTLTISGDATAGRATLSGFQIVTTGEPLATIVSFTAAPGSFTAGETITLDWEVADADSVSIDQGIGAVPATGTLALTPSVTTTWTLTAVRGGTAITAPATATRSKGSIDVYLLGGQSNMQGTGRSSKLPAALLSIPEIQLYAGGTGVNGAIANRWVPLQPSGGGAFGPEIGIGERMRNLCPGQPIALVKYATSGTSLEIGRAMAYAMLNLDPHSYADWATSFGLAGSPDADDDGDGLSNRAEFVLGGNPTDPADAPHPVLGVTGAGGEATPTYTITRHLEAADLAPEVEFSSDLVDWASDPPVFVSSVRQAGGTAVLTFRGPRTLADPAHPRGFFRTMVK